MDLNPLPDPGRSPRPLDRDPARAKARREAIRRGIPGESIVLPEEFTAEVRDRMDFMRGRYLPDHPAEEWHFARLCTDLVRLDQVTHQLIAARDEQAIRAVEAWDDDRNSEAEDLGALLPNRPDRVRNLLLKTRHGAAWMVARWRSLDRQVARRGHVDGTIAARALDLLGVPKNERVGALADRLGVEPERPDGDGPDAGRFAGPEAMAAWRDLVAGQVADLERRIDAYLADRDSRARSDAEVGIGAPGPEVKALLREEAKLVRWKASWERELRRLQRRDRQRDLLDDRPSRSIADPRGRAQRDEALRPLPDVDLDDEDEDDGRRFDRPARRPADRPGPVADRHVPTGTPAPTRPDPPTPAAPKPTPTAPQPPSSPTAGLSDRPIDVQKTMETWAKLSPGTQGMIRRLSGSLAAFKASATGEPSRNRAQRRADRRRS